MAYKFSVIFIFLAFLIKGQKKSIAEIDFLPTDTIDRPYTVTVNQPYIFIASSFGSDRILQGTKLDSISDFLIKEIVLVYSRYHKSENFSQSKLNDARWNNLLKDYPQLFQNGTTRYKNICQDGLTSDTVAKKLTHGFYIYFENRADPVKRETEISEISKMVQAMGIDTAETSETESAPVETEEIIPLSELRKKHSKFKKPMRTIDPKACRQPFYMTGMNDLDNFFKEHITLTPRQKRHPKKLDAEVLLRLDFNGFIKSAHVLTANKLLIEQIRKALSEMNVWNPAVKNGITIKSDVKFLLHCTPEGKMGLKGTYIVSRNLAKCGTASDEELFDFSKKEVKERMIPTVFEVPDNSILRQVIERHPALDSLMLVVDLTGSMGPYIAQVLDLMAELVIKDNPHVSCISLFNDGDSKPDRNKQVGKTEGIIILNEDITLEKLAKAIIKSMKRGTGGDCMENNIEAVLKGIDKCRDCRDIVMIADNLATPRDGSLINSIDRPIHWILCGVNGEINVHYLDLVRANKGVLHTNKSDVLNLHLMKDNEMIMIDGFTYQLSRGKFKLLNIL
jgi:hypothetical protein